MGSVVDERGDGVNCLGDHCLFVIGRDGGG